MSTISSVNSSSDAWAQVSAKRTAHQAKMFEKVDTDGNGSINQTELDSLVSDISQKTGKTVGGASGDNSALFSKMDSNADGSLSSDELGQGMKAIMPAPPSTTEFAQSHGPEGSQGMPPPSGPPPGASASGTSSSATTSGTSSSSTDFDPLDINEDGTVSEMERLAGALKELADSDSGDGTATPEQSAIYKLAQTLYDQISANILDKTSATSLSVTA